MTKKMDTLITNRKDEHIRINLQEDVQFKTKTGLENFSFIHEALPEVNLGDIDLQQNLFGKQVKYPILISSMTGGTPKSLHINHTLATIAQEFRIVMGVGSQRAAIEDPNLANTFKVRQKAPDILLFANLGAIQLNYGYSSDTCKKAIDMIEADALYLHLNPLQEALQPEGETKFNNLLRNIEKVAHDLNTPIIIKEVGFGISGKTARKLFDCGISAIDVSGSGGTSWAKVEMLRAKSIKEKEIAQAFSEWGIPTVDSIVDIINAEKDAILFASGGLRNGVDIAKCLALGAKLGGMAGKILKVAAEGEEILRDFIGIIINQIKICLFATGKARLSEFDLSVLRRIN